MATPIIAANAYATLARMRGDTANIGAGLGNSDGGGGNFTSILKDVMDAVTASAQKSDVQTQAVAAGKSNMVDVVTAVAETETTFQTMISVRDKVIAAYEEVLRMQI
jgi:flagellar hook-basal body complex protein FliE